MTIKSAIENATIVSYGSSSWLVTHPSNGAILFYCDTKNEAEHAIRVLNDLSYTLAKKGTL